MIKGGYKVIDLKDIPLSSVPFEIPGIYNKISKSYEKPILISNLVIDDVECQDYYTQPIKTLGGDFTMTVGDYTLTITASDNVSVAEGIIGGGGGGTTYTAGDNIQIQNGVISATDTTYSAGNNIQISEENVISATDTTYNTMTGATASTAGASGLVPAPAAGDENKALCGDGTYHTIGGSKPLHIVLKGYYTGNVNKFPGYNNRVEWALSNTSISLIGDPTDCDVATIDIRIGRGSYSDSSINFRGSCSLHKEPISSGKINFNFVCPCHSSQVFWVNEKNLYNCQGTLTYDTSTQTWTLYDNIVFVTGEYVDSDTPYNNSITLNSTDTIAIFNAINALTPTGNHAKVFDFASHSGMNFTIDDKMWAGFVGSGRLATGLTITGVDTDQRYNVQMDCESINVTWSKTSKKYNCTFSGIALVTASDTETPVSYSCISNIVLQLSFSSVPSSGSVPSTMNLYMTFEIYDNT